MEFNIEEYKKNPERKLILRHYRQEQSMVWPVEEIQIAIGDIIVIKTPDTGYSTNKYQALDGDELRDEGHNLVGTLEFANERLTMPEFIERLVALPLDCTIDFSTEDDKEHFGVTKLERFNTALLLFSMYGGGYSHVYDIKGDVDNKDLQEFTEEYLRDYFSEFIYIDTSNCINELWGVTFEHTNVDDMTFRRLATSGNPFFSTKEQAEQYINQHTDDSYDQKFDRDCNSNPVPVLLDRWSINEVGKCCRHI